MEIASGEGWRDSQEWNELLRRRGSRVKDLLVSVWCTNQTWGCSFIQCDSAKINQSSITEGPLLAKVSVSNEVMAPWTKLFLSPSVLVLCMPARG